MLLLLTAKANLSLGSRRPARACAEPRLTWESSYELSPQWAPEFFVAANLVRWPRSRPLQLEFDKQGQPRVGSQLASYVQIRGFSPVARARLAPFCAVQVVVRTNVDDSRAIDAPRNLFSRPVPL
eukprot:2719623-Prymnesium_polylepis.1